MTPPPSTSLTSLFVNTSFSQPCMKLLLSPLTLTRAFMKSLMSPRVKVATPSATPLSCALASASLIAAAEESMPAVVNECGTRQRHASVIRVNKVNWMGQGRLGIALPISISPLSFLLPSPSSPFTLHICGSCHSGTEPKATTAQNNGQGKARIYFQGARPIAGRASGWGVEEG